MFGMRKKQEKALVGHQRVVDVPAGHDDLVARADALLGQAQDLGGTERADVLDERGELLSEAGEDDLAITAFEESIATTRRMGAAYRGLTTLYNRKRREAVETGDDEAMKLYFDKLQNLMKSSKDMLRGK